MRTNTISQIGLAMHFGQSAWAIRAQGVFVGGETAEGVQETWARVNYANGRLAYYQFLGARPKSESERASLPAGKEGSGA